MTNYKKNYTNEKRGPDSLDPLWIRPANIVTKSTKHKTKWISPGLGNDANFLPY